LTLLIGGIFWAVEIRAFMSFDLAQAPPDAGAERHVVLINPNGFYSADLVQNDPWLRGNVIRMLSQGLEKDRAMMKQYYPGMHAVYADTHGVIWSTTPQPLPIRH